jgi:hypothetical protein
MDFLPSFHARLSNESIIGLQAIQYIFFIIVTLVSEPKSQIKFGSDNIDEFVENFVEKIKCIYNNFSTETDIDIKDITIKLFDLIKSIDIKKLNKLNVLNEIFKYYLSIENLAVIKDYIKYYNKKILTEWILNIGNPKISDQMEKIFVGNTKINSFLDVIVEKCQDKKVNLNKIFDKLYGHQNNLVIKSLVISNLMLNSNKNFNQNVGSSDLLIKDIDLHIKSFDLIYFDFPSGIHNIIHAYCCNKIKKLKLRGTKFEPLLLQLIIGSLNKNGRAVLIVPDTLLFSDSIQPIETRKYLIENFNVKKITQIDESLYEGKGNKNSILYFENNGPTKSVEFTKINLKIGENIIEETKQTNIPIDKIKSNMYSLYYKNYELIKNLKQDIKSKNFDELFEFKTNSDSFINKQIICLEKYYKNDKSISIGSLKQDCWEHYIVGKNNDTNYFNIKLLENILKAKYQNLVKGKMNQFDLNKIYQLEIPIVSQQIMKSVCEYMDITEKIISDNNEKINSTFKLKSCLMNSINLDNMISIEKIAKLYDKKDASSAITNNNSSTKMIGIIRNGLSAGQVYILDSNENISTNSHYITITNINYLLEFIYHWLKHNEPTLKELANLNPQPNLSQTNLLNFKIPKLSIENQIEIFTHCNDFDSVINKYEANNKALLDKDIIGTIMKINVFC